MRVEKKKTRRRQSKRTKLIFWSPYQIAGVWFDPRQGALKLAGPLKSMDLGARLLILARDLASTAGIYGALSPERKQLLGKSRWKVSVRMPLGRRLIWMLEKAVREGALDSVRVRGPVSRLGRLVY